MDIKNLTVKDITKKFIKDNFNLNAERQMKDDYVYINDIDIKDGGYTPDQFIEYLRQNIPDNTTKIIVSSYGYDGGQDIECYTSKTVPEKDSDVITRLQNTLKDEIKALKAVEEQYNTYLKLRDKFEGVDYGD